MSHDSQPEGSTSWREIAQRASKETDPRKLSYLVADLCAMLEEEQREKKENKIAKPPVLPKPNGRSSKRE